MPIPGVIGKGGKSGEQVLPVRLVQEFITKLPSRALVPYYRTLSVNGPNTMGLLTAAAPTTRAQIDNVQTRLTRIIMDMRQFWLDLGSDPVDGNVYQRLQADQAINGRVPFELLLDGTSPFNVEFNVMDPGAGVTPPRTGSGFLALNDNLLEMGGAEPVAVYVQENQRIQCQWYLARDAANNVALPAHIPNAMCVELRGFTMPTAEFDRVLELVRG